MKIRHITTSAATVISICTLLFPLFVVAKYANWFPWADEWGLLPFILGDRGATLEWFLAPHNEHRPITLKCTYYILFKLFNPDCRLVIYANIVMMWSVACTSLYACFLYRNREIRFVDTLPFFILMNVGIGSYIWGFQNQFATGTALFTLFVVLMGLDYLKEYKSVGINVCQILTLVLLALVGGNGVIPAFTMSAYSLLKTFILLKFYKRISPKQAIGFAVGYALSLGMVIVYLFNYKSVGNPWGTPSVIEFIVFVKQICFSFLGTKETPRWLFAILSFLVLMILIGMGIQFVSMLRNRFRDVKALFILDMLACIVTMGVLFAMIAWGRAARGWTAHYGTTAIPLGFWVFFTAVMLRPNGRFWSVTIGILTVFFAVVILYNYYKNAKWFYQWNKGRAQEIAEVTTAWKNAENYEELAGRKIMFFHFQDTAASRESVVQGLEILHETCGGEH